MPGHGAAGQGLEAGGGSVEPSPCRGPLACVLTAPPSVVRRLPLQPVRSFKVRGAYNRMSRLTQEQARAWS